MGEEKKGASGTEKKKKKGKEGAVGTAFSWEAGSGESPGCSRVLGKW